MEELLEILNLYPNIEAVRQLRWELGVSNSLVIHLTLVPYLSASGELKTKPTQHSVKALLENGVQPDILVLRTEKTLNEELRKKVGLFCNVDSNSVIESIDVSTIYEVPLLMQKEKLDITALKKLQLPISDPPKLTEWKDFLKRLQNPKHTVKIALVGKYVELPDAYKSIVESFVHAGAKNECKVNLISIHSEAITEQTIDKNLEGFRES